MPDMDTAERLDSNAPTRRGGLAGGGGAPLPRVITRQAHVGAWNGLVTAKPATPHLALGLRFPARWA